MKATVLPYLRSIGGITLLVIIAWLSGWHHAGEQLQAQDAGTSSGGTFCQDTLPSRLIPGLPGRVVMGGGANNVRQTANRSAELVGKLEEGTVFEVLAGPACQDGFAWYQVRYDQLSGWTVEAIDTTYALEPLLPSPALPAGQISTAIQSFPPGDIAASGISFQLDPTIADLVDINQRSQFASLGEPFILPDHLFIELHNLTGSFFGRMTILPAVGFDNLHPNSLNSLRQALAEAPDRQTALDPRLYETGFVGSAYLMEQEQYIQFQNGAGYRWLVYYTSDDTYYTSDLFYVFIGLTNDGRHLIIAQLPLAYQDQIPPTPDWNSTVLGDREHYLMQYQEQIAGAANSSFKPLPSQYDALINSIAIDASLFTESIAVYEQQAIALSPTAPIVLATSSAATAERQLTVDVAYTANAVLYPSATPDPNRTPTSTPVQCGDFVSRLSAGNIAFQALQQDSLRVRDMPGGNPTGQSIFPGERVRVVEGPTCLDGAAWWHITALDEAWEGWVVEHSDEKYFYDPITVTPTPTVTFTPTITFTPTQTFTPYPTSTQVLTTCQITAPVDTRLRFSPDVTVEPFYYLGANEPVYVDYYIWNQGERYPWLRIVADAYVRDLRGGKLVQAGDYLWIRDDFVRTSGNCQEIKYINP